MSNEQIIRAFAESKGHKVAGNLHMVEGSSDMKNRSYLWYEDHAGTRYLLLPKYNLVSHILNIHTGLSIRN